MPANDPMSAIGVTTDIRRTIGKDLRPHFRPVPGHSGLGRKALTVQDSPSIRPPMAAGAIPPPLFFEQRRFREHFGFRTWHPQERLR